MHFMQKKVTNEKILRKEEVAGNGKEEKMEERNK